MENRGIYAASAEKVGDYRCKNLHQGGKASIVKNYIRRRKWRKGSQSSKSGPFAGVDFIIRFNKGPLLLEVILLLGLEGIENATGKDIANNHDQGY